MFCWLRGWWEPVGSRHPAFSDQGQGEHSQALGQAGAMAGARAEVWAAFGAGGPWVLAERFDLLLKSGGSFFRETPAGACFRRLPGNANGRLWDKGQEGPAGLAVVLLLLAAQAHPGGGIVGHQGGAS